MEYNSGVAQRPAIFVSSTCYDLKQIRKNIQDFIENDMGYEAILSEYDSFPIDPDISTVNNCLRVVEQRADILVLIVGGRYGSIADYGNKSITNLEYLRAKAKGIPIYAFIDKTILNVLPLWESNPEADFSKYVDTNKLFEFVKKVRNTDSVWVHEFENSNDIINCLKKQLAYLFNDSLLLWKHLHKSKVSSKVMNYSGEVFQLAVEKPEYWEYRLFAAALKNNFDKLDDLRYDLKYGISFDNVKYIEDPVEIISWVGLKINELRQKNSFIEIILNQAIQQALGKPDESGDEDHIIYVAERLTEVYKSLHKWTLDFRSVIVPDEYEKLLLYASQVSTTIIEDIEGFVEKYYQGIQQLLLDLDNSMPKNVRFTLELREPDMNNFNVELEKIQNRLLGH